MLIVNADDYGRSQAETDAALACFRAARVTSVSAMVFMADSERAAALAKEDGVDAGLHLNFSEPYNGRVPDSRIIETQQRLVRFQTRGKYSVLFYHPGLRTEFREVYCHQFEEFVRLFGRPPSHIDGHQHRHLSANMLVDSIITTGQKVRRSFYFGPGEKSWLNRVYRWLVDRRLSQRYLIADYLFNLAECLAPQKLRRIGQLAADSTVELETHPCKARERDFLMGLLYLDFFGTTRLTSYARL